MSNGIQSKDCYQIVILLSFSNLHNSISLKYSSPTHVWGNIIFVVYNQKYEAWKVSQAALGRLIDKRPERISEWENDKHAIKLGEFLEIAKTLKIKNINTVFKD